MKDLSDVFFTQLKKKYQKLMEVLQIYLHQKKLKIYLHIHQKLGIITKKSVFMMNMVEQIKNSNGREMLKSMFMVLVVTI